MISQLSPSARRPSQLYLGLLAFAMLAGAWLLRCHKYLVLVCTELPGVQAEDAALTQHGRNACSQLGLDTVPEFTKLLGTQSRGVMLQGSGFIWSLCHFPQWSCLGNAIQRQRKCLTLDKKRTSVLC